MHIINNMMMHMLTYFFELKKKICNVVNLKFYKTSTSKNKNKITPVHMY